MCFSCKRSDKFPFGFALLFVLLSGLRICNASKGYQKACNRSMEELLTWIRNGYDGFSRPNKTGEPVTIIIESYISSIGSINEENMEFSLDMFFRQRWNDSRLCYLPVRGKPTDQRLILSPEISKHVWKPNIYFRNSKEARFHLVPTQNVLFGITPDGCILMSARITTVLSCQMNFRHFPMDQQTCNFYVGSYSQTEDDIIVKWGAGNRGVIVPNYLEIPQFDISKVVVRNRNRSYNTGVFSEPQATFVFKRRVMFYVYGFYLPVVLVVLLSWISFWIDPESTPARVSLGVITILAMGNFLHGGGATPNVSYATALDVYMITCFVFVFACLLEYAAVHCALNKSQKAEINEACSLVKFSEPTKSQPAMEGMENESVSSASTITLPMTSNENEVKSVLRRKSLVIEAKLRYIQFNSTSLESYSRVAFPLCFLIFNVAYWLTYLGPGVENHGVW
ncbi:glycine receptor subunit alphaZ1-like [Acropora muricata]|uniref:glycine receptor subunit alphaZ1-like n=1 Tax=Acropora muricata TaxID=159855 RepID=UPI0034E3C4F3